MTNLQQKITNLSDFNLLIAWQNLGKFGKEDMYDDETSMDIYATIIYNELDKRGIDKEIDHTDLPL